MVERSVIIKDGDKTVRELVVLWDHRMPCMCQFAIKLHERHYLMISRDKFNRIIRNAETAGLMVFDYTDF